MSTGTSIALVALLAVFTTGCASTKPSTPSAVKPKTSAALRPVPKLDLPRFMGDWRVIAKLPKHGYDPVLKKATDETRS